MTPIIIACPACGRELKIRDRNLLGRKGKCPKCGHAFLMEEPAEVELELAENSLPAEGTGARWVAPNKPQPVAPAPVAAPFTVSATPPILSPELIAAPLPVVRRRSSKGQWVKWVVAAVVLCGVAGVGAFAWNNRPPESHRANAGPDRKDNNHTEHSAIVGGTTHAESLTASPTKGTPIPLEMLPSGAQILMHIRPAELWQAESQGEEFRYCLGPLGEFLDQQIKTVCKKPPQEIESALFAWIANTRGTPPSMAVVVRLKDEAKKSELLDMFGGERVETYGRPVYVNNDQAALILDLKTYAIGPAKFAQDMVESIGGHAAFSSGVEEIMAKTDRDRHFTIIFEPTAVLLDEEFLAPTAARPLLRECMDWFGDDAEAVAWSFQLEQNRFFSDLVVRNKTTVRPMALEERMLEKVGQIPKDLWRLVQQMKPTEVGKRKVIGRLPAMTKAFAMSTVGSTGSRHVELITPLPERAAPNLALGALLAWDEGTRTKFSSKPTGSGSDEPKSSVPVAERLKKKIDIDFRRTPLQDAVAYIADETKVKIDIDGDALKLAGYTKNMTQEFKMDQATGLATFEKIFTVKGQEKLCLVIDEKNNQAIVMTHQAAEAKGLKPYSFKP